MFKGKVVITVVHCLLAIVLLCGQSACKKDPEILLPSPDLIVETRAPEVVKISLRVNEAIGGYMIGLPQLYHKTKKKYPLIVFFHGLGQIGNGKEDLHYLANDGLGKLLASGQFPPHVMHNGEAVSFIAVCPQMDTIASIEEAENFLGYIYQTYRVDEHRLYMTGMSLGARLATRVVASHPKYYAALAPMSGLPTPPGNEDRVRNLAIGNVPIWAFHNTDDPTSDVDQVTDFIDQINLIGTATPARVSLFDAYGHDAWTTALDPNFRENGVNLYQWLLQFQR